ncbi:MAG: LamG domain-containing protein [Chloroflexi bacterium]|nr:LamG domain-containing protein [Chloroflexota bacterium]
MNLARRSRIAKPPVRNSTHVAAHSRRPAHSPDCGNQISLLYSLPPTNGLVGHWSVNTGSVQGTTLLDVAGANDGTITNGPTVRSSGANGAAMVFDGVDDYVTVPDDASLKFGTGDFFVAFWAKPDAVQPDVWPVMVSKDDEQSVRQEWSLFIGQSTPRPRFEIFHGGTGATADSNTDIDDGNWHHIVGVKTSGLLSIYVDGVLRGTKTHALGSTDKDIPLSIGNRPGSSDRAFAGGIDEVRATSASRSGPCRTPLILRHSKDMSGECGNLAQAGVRRRRPPSPQPSPVREGEVLPSGGTTFLRQPQHQPRTKAMSDGRSLGDLDR